MPKGWKVVIAVTLVYTAVEAIFGVVWVIAQYPLAEFIPNAIVRVLVLGLFCSLVYLAVKGIRKLTCKRGGTG